MQLSQTPKAESKPLILDLSLPEDRAKLQDLQSKGILGHVVDHYQSQLEELYAIEHPEEVFTPDFSKRISTYVESLKARKPLEEQGKWIYFPWSCTLVHLLEDEPFQKVRTARNRHLISDAEQKKFYDTTIGIAGLSVGNSIALAIVLLGGARRIKLADHDSLDLSNLNRIRAGVEFLGLPKVEMTARQIYALNPYAQIELFSDGLTDQNIESFFQDLTLIIDEIDNLAVKYRIREYAKKYRLPVLMAADNDRMGVIDVERYDVDSQLEFFHGKLKGETYESLAKLDKRGIGRTIAQLVGLENHTPRMLTSLTEMGKSIVSWPQLGITALLNGSFVAYGALKVANNQPLIDTRAIVAMDELLEADYSSPENMQIRKDAIEAFKKILQL